MMLNQSIICFYVKQEATLSSHCTNICINIWKKVIWYKLQQNYSSVRINVIFAGSWVGRLTHFVLPLNNHVSCSADTIFSFLWGKCLCDLILALLEYNKHDQFRNNSLPTRSKLRWRLFEKRMSKPFFSSIEKNRLYFYAFSQRQKDIISKFLR